MGDPMQVGCSAEKGFKTKHERENAAPPKKGTVSYTVAFRAIHPREPPSGKWSNECPPVLRKQRGGGGGGEFTEEAKETTEANGRGHRVRDTMSGTER